MHGDYRLRLRPPGYRKRLLGSILLACTELADAIVRWKIDAAAGAVRWVVRDVVKRLGPFSDQAKESPGPTWRG